MLMDAATGKCPKCCGENNYLCEFGGKTPLETLREMEKVCANWQYAF